MENEVIIDGVNVTECNKYCKTDNYNELNKCWSDISERYRDCKPKDYQCCFYVEQIEKQLQRAKQKIERLENLLIKRLNAYQNQKKKLEQISEIVKEYQFCQQLIDIKNIIYQECKNE